MKLSSDATVLTLPAKLARELMQAINRRGRGDCLDLIYHDSVAAALYETVLVVRNSDGKQVTYLYHSLEGVSKLIAPMFIAAMIAEGYLEETGLCDSKEESRGPRYRITEKARELTRVSFSPRLTREKAIEKLDAFLARVAQANANVSHGLRITNVCLYGSLIRDEPDVGDIDLAVLTTWVEGHPRPWGASKDLSKFLKNRSPHISMHGFAYSEIDNITGGYIQIVKDGDVCQQSLTLIPGYSAYQQKAR